MSMRKILRGIAKAEMKKAGMDHINRKMRGNTWRRVVNAWPTDVRTDKPMRHDYIGMKDQKTPDHRFNRGCRLFIYAAKFGDVPPRKRFDKQTGKWYYGPRKTLGKVVAVNEAG